MQLFSVQGITPHAPPPECCRVAGQRAVVERAAGSPAAVRTAELPVNVQLFSVQSQAPPPWSAELPVNVQLLSVQSAAPPPMACQRQIQVPACRVAGQRAVVERAAIGPAAHDAELPVSTQLDSTALVDSQYTPPP